MINPAKLKASVRKIAREKEISSQLVLQYYVLEHFLERVSSSRFRDDFIVKGGFLVSCLLGLDTRATMDLDATIKNYPVYEETIQNMISEIIRLDIDDGIQIVFVGIKNIREGDDYHGYRATLEAKIGSMKVPFKLDITTGDKITPHEIEYAFESLIDKRPIGIKAYNLSTLLAEKLETIISRGVSNTRMRDYYDVYVLSKFRVKDIDWSELRNALLATCRKRKTLRLISSYRETLYSVSSDGEMLQRWSSYRSTFEHAKGLDFSIICLCIIKIFERMFSQAA